jgi:microcystin-dependent protein
MKKIIITFIVCYLAINSFGQVSIGNPLAPNSNVILDLTNTGNKGLLLPNINTGPNKPLGNIFYNNSKNMIGVVVDTTVSNYGINYLSPWKHTDENSDVTFKSDIGKVIINYTGSLTTKVILEVNDGDLEVNDGDVNVQDGKIKEYGYDLVPQGAIIMWSGATNNIPPGWSLCDGTIADKLDGTGSITKPDLRERFIVGAGGNNPFVRSSGYGSNANGGDTQHTLNMFEMPPHTHQVNDPGHSHPYTYRGGYNPDRSKDGGFRDQFANNSYPSNTSNAYTGITLSNTGGFLGNAFPFSILPPYYALAFIIKL